MPDLSAIRDTGGRTTSCSLGRASERVKDAKTSRFDLGAGVYSMCADPSDGAMLSAALA